MDEWIKILSQKFLEIWGLIQADMHLDGGIDSETYHLKLEEYKKRQREITAKMKAHVNADETCLITAKTVLDLAKRAKELFISSKMPEK